MRRLATQIAEAAGELGQGRARVAATPAGGVTLPAPFPGGGGGFPISTLFDTNIVIHLAALDAAHLPGEMVISAVTLAELSAGPHHTDDPAERAERMSVLQHAEARSIRCRLIPRRHESSG